MTSAQNTALAADSVTQISMRDLIEAGCHFGHQTAKWNPKMKPYIHDSRNGVYIINLQKTAARFRDALESIKRVAASGQKILFVGTKKQAQNIIKEEATRCGQFYVTERWIGGTLTNYHTIKRSISVMKNLQKMAEEKSYGIRKKKEILSLEKKRGKLEINLLGIQNMSELPGAVFIIDPNREYITVNEARALNIPIIAFCDTNCDTDGINHVIPGNDDSIRAIRVYASKIADAIIAGQGLREENLKKLGAAADGQPQGEHHEGGRRGRGPKLEAVKEVTIAPASKDSSEEKK